jgi:phosphopantothenoylcysteine decarboxylase/phosphopantothenate--cysteine ligase
VSEPSDTTDPRFAGRRIIVGLSGGIACYKVCTVVSRLAQAGAEVTVAMTEAATRFVTPLTFEALSGRGVRTSAWDRIEPGDPQHIRLARSADAMLIAPATMDMIARLAHGLTDDVVSLIASAINVRATPVFVAPSMNATMLGQASTQRNLVQLEADGFRIIAPGVGWQACRTVGAGRLPEPEALLDAVGSALAFRRA